MNIDKELLSLLTQYQSIESYKQVSLEYTSQDTSQIINDFIHLQHPSLTSIKFINKTSSSPPSFPLRISPKFPQLSTRKTYEILQFSNYILSLNESTPFEFIVDVGAGKSYLGQSLSSHFKIISIEKDVSKVKTFNRFIRQSPQIHQTTDLRFGEDTIHFINSQKARNGELPRALIVGLDTCGDLPNMIMDGVVEGVKGLDVIGCCFVSCCFHKVSRFVSDELKGDGVRFDVLGYGQDLRFLSNDEIVLSFKKEFYKEVLELELDDVELTGLKNKDFENWESSISRVGEVYGFEQLDHLKFNQDEFIGNFIKWCFVKGVLSQVVETLVHHDRVRYLQNHGVGNVSIDALFDFNKSSRNILITGIKL